MTTGDQGLLPPTSNPIREGQAGETAKNNAQLLPRPPSAGS